MPAPILRLTDVRKSFGGVRALAGVNLELNRGSVTALIVGTDAAVAAMMDRLWQGPAGASVRNVASRDIEPDEQFSDFRIMV